MLGVVSIIKFKVGLNFVKSYYFKTILILILDFSKNISIELKLFRISEGASNAESKYYEIQSWLKVCQRLQQPLPLVLYRWSLVGTHVHQTSLPRLDNKHIV